MCNRKLLFLGSPIQQRQKEQVKREVEGIGRSFYDIKQNFGFIVTFSLCTCSEFEEMCRPFATMNPFRYKQCNVNGSLLGKGLIDMFERNKFTVLTIESNKNSP